MAKGMSKEECTRNSIKDRCDISCKSYTTIKPAYSASSASSVWSNNAIGVSHGTGQLDSAQGWSARQNKAGEWWQMDMGTKKQIGGVVTQGRTAHGQYVKSFKVQTSVDGQKWTSVDGGKVFTANTAANNAKVENKFLHPVSTRYVRIVVQTWNGHISMRAAVLLCSGGCATDATDKTTFRQRLCVGKVQGHHFKRRANKKPATADALSGCQIKPCPPKCKKAIKKTTEAGEPTTPYTTVVCAPSAECLAARNKCIQSIQQAQSALNTKLSSALKDYTQQRQAIARG